MVKITVTNNTGNFAVSFRKKNTKIKKRTDETVKSIGNFVLMGLRINTPYRTGETSRSIIIKDIRQTKTGSSLSLAQSYIPHEERTKNYTNTRIKGQFNLFAWMLMSRKALSHPWKSGNIPKLRVIIPEARKQFRIRIRNDVINSIKNK